MPNTPEHISYINVGNEDHPIDAVTLGGHTKDYYQEGGKLVTHISSSSTDDEYPSAKCIYELIWGTGSIQPVSDLWYNSEVWDENEIW